MEAADKLIGTVEAVLEPLGLMSGDFAIPKRLLFGAVVGGLVVVLLKPSAMFDPEGNARPWGFMLSAEQQKASSTPATSTPWIFGPIFGAFVFGALI